MLKMTNKLDCYNDSNASGDGRKTMDLAINQFITYEKVDKSNPQARKIKIIGLKDVYSVDWETLLSKTNCQYKKYIEILFKDLMNSYADNNIKSFKMTTGQMLKKLNFMPDFYYDYAKIHYDKIYNTTNEVSKLDNFLNGNKLIKYKNYFVDIMESLQGNIYTQFSSKSIEQMSKNYRVIANRKWEQDNKPLPQTSSNDWTTNYIKPLENQNILPKYITLFANRNYEKANNLNSYEHSFIYRTWHFDLCDNFIQTPYTYEIDIARESLNNSFLKKLEKDSAKIQSGFSNSTNKKVFDTIIKRLEIS